MSDLTAKIDRHPQDEWTGGREVRLAGLDATAEKRVMAFLRRYFEVVRPSRSLTDPDFWCQRPTALLNGRLAAPVHPVDDIGVEWKSESKKNGPGWVPGRGGGAFAAKLSVAQLEAGMTSFVVMYCRNPGGPTRNPYQYLLDVRHNIPGVRNLNWSSFLAGHPTNEDDRPRVIAWMGAERLAGQTPQEEGNPYFVQWPAGQQGGLF